MIKLGEWTVSTAQGETSTTTDILQEDEQQKTMCVCVCLLNACFGPTSQPWLCVCVWSHPIGSHGRGRDRIALAAAWTACLKKQSEFGRNAKVMCAAAGHKECKNTELRHQARRRILPLWPPQGLEAPRRSRVPAPSRLGPGLSRDSALY